MLPGRTIARTSLVLPGAEAARARSFCGRCVVVDEKPAGRGGFDLFIYRVVAHRRLRTARDGQGVGKNTKQAVRWLFAAANKGQYQAQAVFGALLFKGQSVARDAPRGLMWLILARDAATPEETWITDLYDAASKQATADELEAASTMTSRSRSRFTARPGLCATRAR